MSLTSLYTPKQIEILKRTRREDWFMLINHGAKRSGKTVIDNDLFLQELMMVRRTADQLKISIPMYILAGYSLGNIQDNVLTELTNKYGIEFKFDKHNNFMLFGVKVITTAHGSIRGIGSIRGMTSFGAYVNEASLANQEVFDEIKARCSGPGARIIADTNPDHPEHWLLKDYIMSDAKSTISYQFSLDDNTFIDARYKQSIIESTPSGMFFDRGIKGLWVSGKGVVYPEFDQKIHVITREQANEINFERYLAGVDWGWEHFGSIVVIGVLNEAYYVVEEHAHQHYHIDEWVKIAQDVIKRYGDIPFYCDSARPDNISKFQENGIKAHLANKKIMAGVESVATLIKANRFFVVYKHMPRFRDEIYNYIWQEKAGNSTGKPRDLFDDVLDSIRYGIYSDITVKDKVAITTDQRINKVKRLF